MLVRILSELKIVIKYVYDVKTSSFALEPGDGYGGKTITSPIDVLLSRCFWADHAIVYIR